MRFASLESVRQSAVEGFRRFPAPLACAWGACAIFDGLILAGGNDRLFAAALVLTLGIPLCFALALLGERRPADGRWARWLPQLAALLALGALALAWPDWTGAIQWRRYAQLSLLAHALVAFLPYVAVREPNGFWQYNRALLERFVLASIFAAVLFAGLEGALASLRPLFGIKVSAKAFELLATWVWFVFHPWFFLAGIPANFRALEERRDVPGTVRVFAQFILVPLVVVYQALLTAYLVRVVVTGKWPSGLIGWLVSAEAIAGILAILLVHPVRERAENLWVRTFARGFYIALVPSIVMLGLSIAKRVSQYGVTEDRYFVIALTAWLGAISAFFIARRDGDIRWIPITLALLAVVTFGGPWGAYHVSRESQRARLGRLLEDSGMWRGRALVPPTGTVSAQHRKELSAVLVYLLDRHGGPGLAPILGDVLAAADSGVVKPESENGAIRAQRLAARMGFTYMNPWEAATDSGQAFSFVQAGTEPRAANPVAGFDYHVRMDSYVATFKVGSRTLAFWCDDTARRMILSVDTEGRVGLPSATPVDTLATAPLEPLIAAVRMPRAPGDPLPRAELVGPGAHGVFRVTLLVGTERPEFRVQGLAGDLYFTLTRAADDSIEAIPMQ